MLKEKRTLGKAVESVTSAVGQMASTSGSRRVARRRHIGDHNILAGFIAGMIGGAVGSWTMERFQAAWSKASERLSKPQEQDSSPSAEQDQDQGEEQQPATVRVATVLSRRVLHRELTEQAKKYAGPAVHYGFGTTMGGLYGAVAAVAPKAASGMGMGFGTALWLVADETTLPALGLAEPPTRYPASTHLYALASHLVYGLTTEVVRRAALRAWDRVSR